MFFGIFNAFVLERNGRVWGVKRISKMVSENQVESFKIKTDHIHFLTSFLGVKFSMKH